MIGRQRGQFKWTHRDLIHMCHVRFEPNDERLQIIKALFKSGAQIIRQMDDPNVSYLRTPATERMEQWMRLKMCEDVSEAADLFRRGHLDYGHLPSHLLTESKFWTLALERHTEASEDTKKMNPVKLSYTSWLQIFLTLNDCGALKSDAKLRSQLLERLGYESAIRDESHVQPLQLLSILNGYTKGIRPAENVKATFYRKKHSNIDGLSTVEADPSFIRVLTRAVSVAMENVLNVTDGNAVEVLVTLDLHKTAQRRRVFNMEHLNCVQAMALLALSLTRRSEDVKVFTFTEQPDVLKPVELKLNDNYEAALRKCKNAMVG